MDIAAIDHLLTTTRSVRRRLDLTRPVEPDVIDACLEIAVQAPNGGNANRYHFVVVTDAAARAGVAAIYRRAYDANDRTPGDDSPLALSADYLADHLHEVPVHIIVCQEGRLETADPLRMATRYGSILPATWSLMLALRARGLGSAWTTRHLDLEAEMGALLGIPDNVTQVALLPVAYFTGVDFRPGTRIPARDRTYWDRWGRLGTLPAV
jgi:nitroreductase